MRKINKGQEPKEWTAYRLTPGVSYQAIPELRQALLEEQGYICAYCMRRIPCQDANSGETSRIDHIKCRDRWPELGLSYNNMVLCCPGAITDDFHCDKRKDNRDISFSPFDDDFINTLKYGTKDGRMQSTNADWDQEINEVLNLNNALLKSNRAEVINAVCHAFAKDAMEKWNNKDAEGRLKPYCGIVVWFMKRWLGRHGW